MTAPIISPTTPSSFAAFALPDGLNVFIADFLLLFLLLRRFGCLFGFDLE
jgi:hypothetical protein